MSVNNIQKLKLSRPYLIIALFLIVLFVYGPLLKRHYALDTYVVEASGNQWEHHIELGRFLSAMFWKALAAVGVNTAVYQSFFTFFAIVLLASSIYLIIRLFSDLKEEWNARSFAILFLASVVSLCHVFMLHWFLFPEVVAFTMTGLILSILAVFLMRNCGASCWICCFCLLLAAMSFYQAAGAFFVAFGMLYVAARRSGQSLASILRGSVAVLMTYGLAGATNILFIKLYAHTDARANFQNINPLLNVYGIAESLQEKLHNTHLGSKPVFAFLLLMLILLIGSGLLLWRSQEKKRPMRTLIVLAVLVISSFIATMAPHLFTSTVDVSPRSIAALLSLPGVISLFIVFQSEQFRKPIYSYLLLGFLIMFFMANTFITFLVERSRFATNRLDREIATMVYGDIMKHEKETGEKIERIAFRHDESPTLCYQGLICYGNFRAMGRDWTIIPLVSIVSGRRFVETNMPDSVYNAHFVGKNWDSFNEEQIVFQGDTLNLMLY